MNKYLHLLLLVAVLAAISFALPSTVLKFRPQQKQDDIVKILTKQSEPIAETLNQPIQYFRRLSIVPNPRLMKFEWSDCGNSSSKIIFNDISVTPDPIVLPGTILVSVNLTINEDITDSLSAQVVLKRKIGAFDIDIPCIANIGSCHYENICSLLNQVSKCPEMLIKHNIPCHCPFKQGNYILPSTGVFINGDPVPEGDYTLKIVLSYKQKFIGCFKLAASFST